MGCSGSKTVETNDDITLKDKPKDKVVHKEVPKNIKSFLKQQNQEFVKFDLSGGHSIFGESLILEAKSLSDNSSIRYMFRQFKPIRDFEWEYYISKEMGEMEVAPKIIFADHKTKFWLQQFVENSITLKPLVYPPESLKQTGVLLKKFHSFSSKIKVPDSYDFFDKVKMNALRIIGSHPMLSRFKRTVEGVDQILKIFEKNSEKCLCHNDFGYGANTLWDKKRPWLIDFEFSGMFYKYFDIGAFISLLIMTEKDRESFLEGYYGGKRSEKEEALVYMGEIYGLYKYSMFAVNLIGEVPEDVNDEFFDNILELNQLRTGKAKFDKSEIDTVRGNIKIASMYLKQAEINMQTEKCKNAMKILGA
jgi:thiamine kinase-like enzyme